MTWTTEKTRELYGIERWGEGYFDISEDGHLIVYPNKDKKAGVVDVSALADTIRNEGLSLPVLVRFTDILRDRVRLLCHAFERACTDLNYKGQYTPIYPIKVNQQRTVIEALLRDGDARVGLESGSKPELLAILALSRSGMIICNGYKDRSYIRLALIGQTLGCDVLIVIEKLSELSLVLSESVALGIEPRLGVRLRLSSISAGKWQNSGGEKSKFGLSAREILTLIQCLREANQLDWLTLMHFHMGSQVANIHDIKIALREAARYYVELHRLGAPISLVDVGGGLGIDYEGTGSTSDCSLNYSMDEYAHSIVRVFSEISAEYNLPEPDLLTESGRAITAHHALLITNVIEVETVSEDPTVSPASHDPASYTLSSPLQGLVGCLDRLSTETVLGIYHDAQFYLTEARSAYVQGALTLEECAEAERLYVAVCHRVHRQLDTRHRAHQEAMDELDERLASKVFCNFSLFQSVPDAWAINQIFPVLPLQRLHDEPHSRAVLQDVTCDSDGRISTYINKQNIETTLPFHKLEKNEMYLIGIFLVGAYQEILGDMHNLFGDTHSINVELDGKGGFHLVEPMRGDAADELLRYVHIDPEELKRVYHKKLVEAKLTPERKKLFQSELIAGLGGYTYLED